uniref:exportin-6-like n=1 Tax=Myxine glutinosa TaxID=7769 RepID=UPI00358DE5A0
MASDEASLRALESIMTEFFHDLTSNERKREIEELLNNFAQQAGAWHHCFFFFSNTRNEYVMMYSLTVLENVVNRLWPGVNEREKVELRDALPKLLLSRQRSLPPSVRNKLCKVIVDIGRQDWPAFYHDFFSNILQLTQHPSNAPIGLILLKTASEELACPREDLSVARKHELRRLLLEQVPTVLSLLAGILETIWDKHVSLNSVPPPSPFTISMGELLGSLFHMPDGGRFFMQPVPTLDEDSQHVCSLTLDCLVHLFSWIPLSTSISPQLLATIFHFARLGCDGGGTEKASALGALAMSCVNELMSKNCVPCEFEEYLLRAFQHTFYLLQKITKDAKGSTVRARLQDLDENYLEGFTEFLRLFVNVHLRRVESSAHFPVVEFLELLFKYTFNQPTNEGYFSCLDIWTTFLDYLSGKIKNRSSDKEAVLARYRDALPALMAEVLRRVQFRFNQSELEELDDETPDDDDQTEWQHFLHQSLEIVARVAELLPEQAFSIVSPLLCENRDVYLGLQQFVVPSRSGRRLNVTAENDLRRLHCSMRDLASMLQATGRLADHFLCDSFSERLPDALSLLKSLVEMAAYGTQLRLFTVETTIPSVLKPDFTEVQAQSLAAVQAYCHWLAQFGAELQRQKSKPDQMASLVSTAVMALVPLLSNKIPEKIQLSAAHLLVSLATCVRPPFLSTLPEMQKLFNKAGDDTLFSLQNKVQVLVCRSLSNSLLLPWPGVPDCEQQWDSRSRNYDALACTLTSSYRTLRDCTTQLDQAKPMVLRTLALLRDMVESVTNEAQRPKQICYRAIEDVVHTTLMLLPAFITQSDIMDEVLAFFLTLFQSLKVQMGAPFTEQMLQTFISMFTRQQLAESVELEGGAGEQVVVRLLKILQVVVQEPGAAFRSFLPSILALSLEQLYPLVSPHPSPSIKVELYELLYLVLQHNWRHFFRTTVLAKVGRCRTDTAEEAVEHQSHFVAIMQAYGQSFLQTDIHIFKQNLAYLESLNSRHKLYEKDLFRRTMMAQFLQVLLQALALRSHDILQDDITSTIYSMATVDFNAFFGAFLPTFLHSCDGLDSQQKDLLARSFKMDQDLPSFMQNMHHFVNDLRYYRLCNSSLPAGTIKF